MQYAGIYETTGLFYESKKVPNLTSLTYRQLYSIILIITILVSLTNGDHKNKEILFHVHEPKLNRGAQNIRDTSDIIGIS